MAHCDPGIPLLMVPYSEQSTTLISLTSTNESYVDWEDVTPPTKAEICDRDITRLAKIWRISHDCLVWYLSTARYVRDGAKLLLLLNM